MSGENEKMTWKEKVRLNRRAFSIWYREYPALFVSTALYSLLNTVFPYITLYFSAQLLNELAGARRKELLIQKIVILLTAEAVVLLIRAVVFRWKSVLSDWTCIYFYDRKRQFYKLLSMDFCDAESSGAQALLREVQQTSKWRNYGVRRVYTQYQEFLEALFKLLGGIVLSVSLFRLPVRADAGRLVMLNHPLCMLLLGLLLCGVTLFSPWLGTIGKKCVLQCDEELKLGNRFFNFFGSLMSADKRALDVRLYGQERFFTQLNPIQNDFGVDSKIARFSRGRMGIACAASAAVSRIFGGLIYLFVCLKAWGGAFGVGSVTQYIGAITAMSGGLAKLLELVGDAGINAFYLKREFLFLDIPNRMYQGSLTVEKRSDKNYEVEFRNVSFRYPGTEVYALKNISLKFKVGERLALVGQNGSGKTTFIKLLCRLYDPTEGEILLNGIDIRKYDYQEYMSVFSVVFQDFQLLAYSVGQNIAACAVYDQERAESCCKKAGFWERVATMPEGLDTILYKNLTEDGVEISGGEEQKIAIARAMYRESAFLILDEPTAALDPIAEYEIYTRLNQIVEDRTAIYISHRLSSCRFCDEIIVFHEGSMVQQGSHEALLMQEGGKYSELWNAQAQYYVSDAS
ncbi:MAG: ABC transporter ATP-binding protein/permease [Lachnospiraceae bacterium]|nr:ABC transporter ATP-binding protein/permease [Lachnospiraceae bacterium]